MIFNVDWLDVRQNAGYGTLPIPQLRDEEIRETILNWDALDVSDRKKEVELIEERQRFTLLSFSERMASLAVRENKADLVYLGLLAVGITLGKGDLRDSLLILPSHYDACIRIHVSPEKIFKEAAERLSEELGQNLKEFLCRSEEDRSLSAMGYQVGSDSDGFLYERTW